MPGAGHLGSGDLQPEESFQHVSRFFDVALTEQAAAEPAPWA